MSSIPWIISGLVIVFVTIAIASWRHEVRRREAIRQFATDMGFGFMSEGPDSTLTIPSRVELFQRGRRPRVRNVVNGRIEDLQVHLFDYTYTTGRGRSQRRHRHTVVAFELPHSSLPPFDLRPEHFFHKIISALGFQDIDFPDRPSFSTRWLLRSRDEAAVRALFTPEVTALFENRERVGVASGRGCLVVYRPRSRVAAADLSQFFEDAFEICNAIA